jgi:hypothetical protein
MPAYVILINNKTTNAAELDRYRTKAAAARAVRPVTLLAVNGKYEVLGELPPRASPSPSSRTWRPPRPGTTAPNTRMPSSIG